MINRILWCRQVATFFCIYYIIYLYLFVIVLLLIMPCKTTKEKKKHQVNFIDRMLIMLGFYWPSSLDIKLDSMWHPCSSRRGRPLLKHFIWLRIADNNTDTHQYNVNPGPNLFVEFGVGGSLVDEQPDNLLVSLPCCQVQRVAALVVGNVGQGLVS